VIDYDGRRFRSAEYPSGAGAPVAVYHQTGDLLWGEFAGGAVRRGALTGLCRDDDTIEFGYTMVLTDGSVLSGRCRSTPEALPDGRIRLHERWERFGAHADTGTSVLEEVSEEV
jgi:hypothetical protein